jgi:hypothetical protein
LLPARALNFPLVFSATARYALPRQANLQNLIDFNTAPILRSLIADGDNDIAARTVVPVFVSVILESARLAVRAHELCGLRRQRRGCEQFHQNRRR